MSVTSSIPNIAFLGLLISLCLYSGLGIAEQIVDTEPYVILEVGTRGVLPCRVQERTFSVEWERQVASESELLVSLHPFSVDKRYGTGYEAGMFNITDDFSLVIKDVKVQDEGLYMCSLYDYKTGQIFRNSTRVFVQAFPDEPFPTIQECIGSCVKPCVCTLTIHSASNLTCFVAGYYPHIELFFLHGFEKVTPVAYEEWNYTDGTKIKNITVEIGVSDEPYRCVASELPGIAGNRTVSVIVQARSKGLNSAAVVVPVFIAMLICLVGICLLLRKRYLGSGRAEKQQEQEKQDYQRQPLVEQQQQLQHPQQVQQKTLQQKLKQEPHLQLEERQSAHQAECHQEMMHTISEDLLKGKVSCNRSRIMVVGPAGVGKTSFINRLTNQSFDQEEKSTVGTVNTHTISQWKLETVPRDELAECLARHQYASREERNFKNHPSRERLVMASKVDGQKLQDLDELAECLARHQNASREERNFKVVKTTSHRSLPTTERVSSQEVQAEPPEPNEGSEEVQEYAKSISAERIHNVTSSANDIIYSIWDFGGQEIYYITHPLFLSWRSLYIAIFPLHKIITENALREEDSSTGQMEGCPTKTYRTMLDLMHFWMMSIYIHAVAPDNMKDPKILLVGTFSKDDHSKSNKEMNISKLLDMVTDKPYGSQVILSVVEVDNKSSSDDEISQIQRKIDDLIKDADYMKEELPIKWRIFLDKTKDLHQDTLKLTEARKIMNEIGIRDDNEVQDVLKFCHDAGHLIYHQGCELIILHPEVLNSFVSNIITVITPEKLHGKEKKDWKLLGKKGVLSMDLINAVWKQHKGKDDELDMVINMMIKFDLMCEIHDTQGAYQGRHFFVPCRSSPTFDLEEQFSSDEFQFIIDFDYFLPDGFLHRLFVRMAKWAMDQGGPKNPSFHCREMLFYIDERHRAKMSNDIKGDDAHRITVTIYAISEDLIRNDNSTVKVECTFIEHLEDTLDELKETWARRITYTMGMICTICQKYGETILVPLNKFLSCKGRTVCCDDCSASISVARVQQSIGLRFDGASGEQVSAHCGTVSDSKLNILARHVPHAAYNHLSDGLMVGYNEAQIILRKHCNDFAIAIRECLAMWKNRTGGRLTELKEILHRAEIGVLVKYLEYVG